MPALLNGSVWIIPLGVIIAVLVYNYLEPPSTKAVDKSCFRAAVYEHQPWQSPTQPPKFPIVVENNFGKFLKAIEAAEREKVDLLVFPEDALFNAGDFTREELIQHLECLPEASKLPASLCNDTSRPLLSKFACLARTHRMFIVLSLGTKKACKKEISPDGHLLHNSQVLLDWNGQLVAYYHKINLYGEDYYDAANKTMVYESPFGRLGFCICFDFLFSRPMIELAEAGVDTIVFSTYWFNWRPFLTFGQQQQAFAIEHNVNVLASNNRIPKEAVFGAGVFQGTQGALELSLNAQAGSKLIVADLPRSGKSQKCAKAERKTIVLEKSEEHQGDFLVNQIKIDKSLLQHLDGSKQAASMWHCEQRVCCRLSYQLASNTDLAFERWTLIVGGQKCPGLGLARVPIAEQYCALVKCLDAECQEFAAASNTTFEWIEMEGNFTIDTIYPSVFTSNYQILPPSAGWVWQKNPSSLGNRKIKLTMKETPILGVAMYGRDYQGD